MWAFWTSSAHPKPPRIPSSTGIPKDPIQIADEFIEKVFTRGLYGVVPQSGLNWNFGQLSLVN